MVADFVDHHARILPGRQWDPDSETGLWTCWVGLLYRWSFIVHRSSFIVHRSSFVVHRSSLAVKDHLPRQMVSFCRNGMTGRHGCAGLSPPIRGRYRQAVHQAGRPACGPYGIAMSRWNFVHQAGRPACGPYGIAMGRWNFVHFAGQPACGPYGIAMDHSPLPSRSARFPISPLCHCSPFSFSFSEEPFDSVHTDWRQGIQILFRWISRGFL